MEKQQIGKHKGKRNHDDQDVKLSKKLSWLLRHGAIQEGLTLGVDGFVSLNEILSRKDFQHIKKDQIIKIIETNDKKRFEIQGRGNELFIRAVQGHTIKTIQDDLLLEEIKDPFKFQQLIHGTYKNLWESIKEQGLKRMNRNHIHFSIGYKEDKEVISGMRNNTNLFIEINIEAAMKDDIKFYISKNNVVLTSGIDGILEAKYFKKVVDNEGKDYLDN